MKNNKEYKWLLASFSKEFLSSIFLVGAKQGPTLLFIPTFPS